MFTLLKEWVLKYFFDLGIYNKSGNLLFLGLDDAGKTTLLNLLKNNKLIVPKPSLHAHSEELVINNIKFTTYDLGGHKQVRKVWKEYFPVVDAIVFIIDVSKHSRFNEVNAELSALLRFEELQNCPILILGNKIDKREAVGEIEIRQIFNLDLILTENNEQMKNDAEDYSDKRKVALFMCSLKERQGYGDGFKWLSELFKG